jgi:uncharacterized protein (UPF0335 family)
MPAQLGDNSTTKELLEETIERVEKLIDERKAITETIESVLEGAEGDGLDKRTLREMIRLRALDASDRKEREALRDLYACTLGLTD